MKEFLLIRHAESMGNAGYKTSSTEENPLTLFGQEQANKLSIFLYQKYNGLNLPDLVVHSHYKRAYQTMESFVRDKNFLVEQWDVNEFKYLSSVKYANTSDEDRRPSREKYWERMDSDYHDDDTAESYNDLITRTGHMLESLLSCTHKRIFVFSHGQFIKAMWLIMVNEGLSGKLPTMSEFYNFTNSVLIPNIGIIKVIFKDGEYSISQLSAV